MFADDTVLYTSGITELSASRKLQENIDILMLWMRDSQLTINASKSKTMTISPYLRLPTKPTVIKMGTTNLDEVKTYKYLGLTIDSQLNFKPHLNMLI